jgi:hypothetical protein
MRTEMGYLVIEKLLLEKARRAAVAKDDTWMNEFELD